MYRFDARQVNLSHNESMARATADIHKSVLIAVDVQPKFMERLVQIEAVMRRIEFVLTSAKLLGGTIIATEQNAERMGGSDPNLAESFSEPASNKMTFSCSGCDVYQKHLADAPPMQVVLVGCETHICVSQTAHELLDAGHEVIVCGDAVTASTADRHLMGLERLRSAGAVVAHSEAVVYEWMRSAEHPQFRDILQLVKRFA